MDQTHKTYEYFAEHTGKRLDISVVTANYAASPVKGRPRPVASLDIYLKDPDEHNALRNWMNRAPKIQKGRGPFVHMICFGSDPEADNAEISLEILIDTRELSEEEARQVFKRWRREFNGTCQGDIGDSDLADAEVDKIKAKQRRPRTYLYYRSSDGVVVTIAFAHASTNIEDSVCEDYLAEMPPDLAATAECVTGTDVWQHAP